MLHRKNALFYRTMNGARVGDLFMSLIHTCDLNGVNAFDYLVELLRHPKELTANPSEWMPWNYCDTQARGREGSSSPRNQQNVCNISGAKQPYALLPKVHPTTCVAARSSHNLLRTFRRIYPLCCTEILGICRAPEVQI